jgi:DNA repair exonuclease SbcCD nuclease subunit
MSGEEDCEACPSFLCIGDPHFKKINAEATEAMQKSVLRTIEKKKPEFIVVMGDLLHDNDWAQISVHKRVSEFLLSLSDTCKKLFVLIGNHDIPNNSDFLSGRHFFGQLRGWKNTVLVDFPHMEVIGNRKFLFVPFVPTGRLDEAIRKTAGAAAAPPGGVSGGSPGAPSEGPVDVDDFLSDVSAVFCHQEFRGSCLAGIGDIWSKRRPRAISGHIHNFKDMIEDGVLYIGTPMQHDFSESEDKTVSLFRFDARGSSDHRLMTHERIDLHLRKKIVVKLDIKDLKNSRDVQRNLQNADAEFRVDLSGTKGEMIVFKKTEEYKRMKADGVIFKSDLIETFTRRDRVEMRRKVESFDADFGTCLYDAVKNNSKVKDKFLELFGGVRGSSDFVI